MIDHSLTYRKFSFKNIPHRNRLNRIIKYINKLSPPREASYVDIGCSNGYITNIIKSKFNLGKTTGRDHTVENLEIAKANHPKIDFVFIDLNKLSTDHPTYDLVTCFETLEHVGNLNNAIANILSFRNSSGKILITVPIETGFVGLIKFVVKTIIFRYKLDELPQRPSWWTYLKALLSGDKMSKFRDAREGWGTHFGFDYNDVDKVLDQMGVKYKASNNFTTRFYILQ